MILRLQQVKYNNIVWIIFLLCLSHFRIVFLNHQNSVVIRISSYYKYSEAFVMSRTVNGQSRHNNNNLISNNEYDFNKLCSNNDCNNNKLDALVHSQYESCPRNTEKNISNRRILLNNIGSLASQTSGIALLLNQPQYTLALSDVATTATTATSSSSSSNSVLQQQQQQFATSAGRKGCSTISDPAKTIVTCTGDVSMDQYHLSSISSTENGVSTSAIKNPERYVPPWSYIPETSNSTKAFQSLYNVVIACDPNIKLITRTDTYLHFTIPTIGLSKVLSSSSSSSNDLSISDDQDNNGKLDDIEFVLRPDDNLVLYRSASRTSIFVYPLTQPVSDQNNNYKRMQKIRTTLGWQEL